MNSIKFKLINSENYQTTERDVCMLYIEYKIKIESRAAANLIILCHKGIFVIIYIRTYTHHSAF